VKWGLLLLVLASCDAPPEPSVFIALQRDFADFRGWQKFYFGDGPLEGHPAGPRYGYVKQVLQPGERAYPVGDIIVKTIETQPSPSPSPEPSGPVPEQAWDLFAMAKRGGGFNADGAKGWEFFTLRINAGGVPVILARGIDASDVPGSSGHGYLGANGNIIRCNGCHGDPNLAQDDYILNPELQPR
jgi:hypothetical protein